MYLLPCEPFNCILCRERVGCPEGVSEGTVVDLVEQKECYLSVRDLLNSLDSVDYLGTERDYCGLRCRVVVLS